MRRLVLWPLQRKKMSFHSALTRRLCGRVFTLRVVLQRQQCPPLFQTKTSPGALAFSYKKPINSCFMGTCEAAYGLGAEGRPVSINFSNRQLSEDSFLLTDVGSAL